MKDNSMAWRRMTDNSMACFPTVECSVHVVKRCIQVATKRGKRGAVLPRDSPPSRHSATRNYAPLTVRVKNPPPPTPSPHTCTTPSMPHTITPLSLPGLIPLSQPHTTTPTSLLVLRGAHRPHTSTPPSVSGLRISPLRTVSALLFRLKGQSIVAQNHSKRHCPVYLFIARGR